LSNCFLGIDLGGSSICAALVNLQGRILHFRKVETRSEEGPRKVVERIVDLAQALRRDSGLRPNQVLGVGIGAPGLIDLKKGVVRFSPNLPGWKDIPLQRQLQAALKRPVELDNDANVAAFGEQWHGAGQGYRNVVVYTLGTGVGGGIILDGEIFHGSCDAAGELGHTTVLPDGPMCNCGNRGCLEALSSGTAIARAGVEALAGADPESPLRVLSGGRPEAVTAKMVFTAARQGDTGAQGVVSSAARYLGISIANLVNLLNPELIVIGGGVSIAGEALLRPVRDEVARRALKETHACVKIVAAKLADQAGVIGAAGLSAHARRRGTARQGGKRS
jgi:glucokinase